MDKQRSNIKDDDVFQQFQKQTHRVADTPVETGNHRLIKVWSIRKARYVYRLLVEVAITNKKNKKEETTFHWGVSSTANHLPDEGNIWWARRIAHHYDIEVPHEVWDGRQ